MFQSNLPYQRQTPPTPTQFASSRRSKVEQKKLTRQIVFFSVLAVVLLAVFVGIIIPDAIRLAGNLSKNSPTTDASNSVPVLVPVLSAPVAATNSASLKLSGFSEKNYTVVLTNNDQEIKRTNTNDDGSFQFDVTLDKGDNTLTVYGIDANNHQSDKGKAFVVNFSDTAPKLDVSEPQDKQTITGKKNQNVTIKGTTDPKSHITLNDRFVFTNDDGTFSTTFQLNDGDNSLDIKATNPAGNTTDKQLTVTFHQ